MPAASLPEGPRTMARPSKYQPAFAEQAAKLCRLGATDKDLADFFHVTERTLNTWKKQIPGFLQALNGGKVMADAEVADRLYQRALGYTHVEDDIRVCDGVIITTPTTRHYPPDTTACIFWLKNRRPDLWRDKPDPTNDDNAPPPVKVVIEVVNTSIPDADA
ncbi:transposase [Bordetella pertussis]|nr:transposase [Bordetella pertussis]ALX22538.1 terminase [Bordetella pertussis]ALX23997.1 terminase [Bordetella pertussis]AMS52538.1 terminase [Bordetella pertussis]AMS56170.1 terminase [Bordetella pertussis]AMS57681.1 terminase [Bordetella pertussis]